MNAVAALCGALCSVLLAYWLHRRARPIASALPVLEGLWFHAVVTWPVVVKAALGSFIFSWGDEGSNSFTLVTYGPGLAVSAVIFGCRLSAKCKLSGPAVIVVAGSIFAAAFAAIGESNGFASAMPFIFALPVLLRRAEPIDLRSWAATAKFSLVLIVAAIAVTALVAKPNVIGPCRLDKCTIFGEVLTSPITINGNFAGIAVALLLPWALIGLRLAPAFLTVLGAVTLVELSGSRSAALAAVVIGIVAVLVSSSKRKWTWLVPTTLALSLFASLVTAVGKFPSDFATGRGTLWDRARGLFTESPVFGHGPEFWVRQPKEVGFVTNYSPHNLWLELAVSGGAVMVIAVAVASIAMLRIADTDDRTALMLGVSAVLIVGILEAPVQPTRVGLTLFAPLVPLMIAASIQRKQSPEKPVASTLLPSGHRG